VKSFRNTATRSNGFKVIKTRARPISARVESVVESMGDLMCLFYRSPAVRAGVNRERHRDCVHMRPEYFDGMQMYEDLAVMTALRWHNLWSSACSGWKSSL